MSFTVPNALSILRMGLVPFFIIAMIDGQPQRALVIFVLAGVTDALDGAIARLYRQQSLLGAYLDPIADKLLLTSAYVILTIPSLNHGTAIPIWITVLVLARDVLILVFAVVFRLAQGVKRFPPSVLSKLTTVVQVTAVAVILLSGLSKDLEPVALGVIYLVAALTLASGIDYILRSDQLLGEKGKEE